PVGMEAGFGQRLIDARLIGAERTAPLQQQRDAIELEPRAQVLALAHARCSRFGDERSFRARRVGYELIAQRYFRDRAIGHGAALPVGGLDPKDASLSASRASRAVISAPFAGRQAAARERRNHSSKPMRPRRASPNGTSECCSTRPPQYGASGSLTTTRGSPTAFR